MVDKAPDEARLRALWLSLGGRLAVSAGALVALISLLQDARVPTACLRGGAGWLAVLVVSRLGLAALLRAAAIDRDEAATGEGGGPTR